MDIIFGDRLKREIKYVMWYLRKKLKKDYKITVEEIHNDMMNCGNPVISEIYELIKDASDRIKEGYQKEITIDFPEVILWIVYRDTAYSPIFMYILKNLMDKKEELMPLLEKYYVEPEKWYVNSWNDAKRRTREQKEAGEIAPQDSELSFEEKIFVPQMQKQITSKIGEIDEKIRKEKLKEMK